MLLRSEKDLRFLEEEVSSQVFAEWQREKWGDLLVPRSIVAWVAGEIQTNYEAATAGEIRQMIARKVIHTREVVDAGKDIGVGMDGRLVESVCLLHDVGRFRQAHLGSFSDGKTGFDHAAFGADLVESNEQIDWDSLLGYGRERIAEAIWWHSRREYPGQDRMAMMIRDADKLALCRYTDELLEIEGIELRGISAGAVESFNRREMVKHTDLRTFADWLLCRLSWKYDLNFELTKEIFESEGIWTAMQKMLKELLTEGEWEQLQFAENS